MDDIDSILDSPDNIAILNGSSWNVVQQVTLENKSELVQRLIDEEVIIRRERNVKAPRKGLETLGLQKLLIRYTSLMKPYFVQDYSPITPDEFLLLLYPVTLLLDLRDKHMTTSNSLWFLCMVSSN